MYLKETSYFTVKINAVKVNNMYRIEGNFRGLLFRWQADLHDIFPHESVGVVYQNACNECRQ